MGLLMAKRKGDTGKNFESEIRRSLKSSKHIWWFRIQDTNDVSRFVKMAVAEKQPADFFSVYKGRPIMLEAKTSRSLVSLALFYSNVSVKTFGNALTFFLVIPKVLYNCGNLCLLI